MQHLLDWWKGLRGNNVQPRRNSAMLERALARMQFDFDSESEHEGQQPGCADTSHSTDDNLFVDWDESPGIEPGSSLAAALSVSAVHSGVPEEATMDVHIFRLTGDTVASDLQISISETAMGVLQLLRAQNLLEPVGHRLAFESCTLQRSDKLWDAGVRSGATLYVVQVQSYVDLDLSSNRLSADGVKALTEALPEDAAIRSLALCSCNLEGTQGGWAVGGLVRRTLALMELRLDANNDFGASSLGAPGINVAALAHALPSPLEGQTLRSLSLNNLNLSSVAGGKAVAAVLHRTPNLKHLALCSNNGLKAVGIEALLQGSPAALIIECLQLRDCGLEGAAAGRAVAAFAAKSSDLSQLDLGKNSNFCCQGLAGFLEECMYCTSLTELDLCNCGLRGPEVHPIVAMLLSRVPTLMHLDLHGNNVGVPSGMEVDGGDLDQDVAEGDKDAAIMAMVRRATMLRKLNLSNNRSLQESGLHMLAQAFRSDVAPPGEEVPLGFELLNVTHCRLQGLSGGRVAAELANTTETLAQFVLFGNGGLGNLGVRELASCLLHTSVLKYLNLGGCGLDAGEGGAIVATIAARSPELEHLYIHENYLLGDAGIVALAEGLPAIGSSTNMRDVNMSVCGLRGAAGADALALLLSKVPDLYRLDLGGNQLGQSGFAALPQILLAGSASLTSLSLTGCGLEGAEGGDVASALLQHLPELKQLKLGSNSELAESGMLSFAQALGPTLNLQSLDVSDCGLKGVRGGRAAAIAVAQLLHGRTSSTTASEQ